MSTRFFLVPALFCTLTVQSQYKNDNIKYQTVFMEDLCAALKNNTEHIILDVRSKGEYADTSSSTNLNIGHLKNAVNINIDELGQRLGEIRNATNKPVFVYCSHSQRSRRASALLADSGFSKVFNINGGLTTFNLLKETGIPCSDLFYETSNQYTLVAPADLAALLKKDENVFLLDIRKDSVFNGTSANEALNANGRLNGAINIPLALLEQSLNQIPKNKRIIIVDDGGNEGPKAAKILSGKGYSNIMLAFNGMSTWNATPLHELPEKNKFWITTAKYKLITADDFDEMAKQPGSVILDVRSTEEYSNQSKESFRNRGNIKGARNIPYTELANRLKELDADKNKPLFLYHFSGQPEVFKAAGLLTENGFTNVHVLMGGIWNLRWRAANIKGKLHLNNLVENVPPENM